MFSIKLQCQRAAGACRNTRDTPATFITLLNLCETSVTYVKAVLFSKTTINPPKTLIMQTAKYAFLVRAYGQLESGADEGSVFVFSVVWQPLIHLPPRSLAV